MCSLKTPIETAAVATSSRKATRLLKEGEKEKTLGLGTELHNYGKLYDTVQARIDTGLELRCFPDRMALK